VALLIGGAMLLEDARPLFAPVISMVGGIAALALTNHERPKLRMDAVEQRLAQREALPAMRKPIARSTAAPPALTTIGHEIMISGYAADWRRESSWRNRRNSRRYKSKCRPN
jgi:hypothetical protein